MNDTVVARAGYKVLPDYHFNNHPRIDVLIVVGGDHTDEVNKPDVISWIASQSNHVQLIASVCTGAFLLAKANVITHHNVTTHWEDIADLASQYPDLCVKENTRWVDEGNVVTSGGISAGIDMSLHLVSKLTSKLLAEETAKQMEFDWRQH
jgi:transcriptional regulator GlxA family with amidase domain